MSTTVTASDDAALRAALAAVRKDNSGVNWCLAGHVDANPNVIGLVGQGNGGVNELVEHLNESNVMYALVRVVEKVEISETIKFVYIWFQGEKVPFAKRGRFGIVKGHVTQTYFSPHHTYFDVENKSELSEEILMKKVSEASMTKNNILDSKAGFQERGFTGKPSAQDSPHLHKAQATPAATSTSPRPTSSVNPSRNSTAPKSPSSAHTNTSTVGLDFDALVLEGIKDVRNDSTETNWMLASYKDMNVSKPVTFVGSGSGGASELVSHLNDKIVAYGLIRVVDVIENIKTVKFVYIAWVGNEVGHMAKAKISTHKGALKEKFSPYHVDFAVTDVKDLTDEKVMDKVMATSGSKSFVQ